MGREMNAIQETHRAARTGDLAQLLLDHGADLQAHGDWKNWTPLHWAAYRGHAAVVELLLARGADPLAVDEEGQSPHDLALQGGHDESRPS
jgi:ankyrin repeat protein